MGEHLIFHLEKRIEFMSLRILKVGKLKQIEKFIQYGYWGKN